MCARLPDVLGRRDATSCRQDGSRKCVRNRNRILLLDFQTDRMEDFKNEKVKLGKKTCTCSFSLEADGAKCSGTAKCDKKCSGSGVVEIGMYTFSLKMKKGKGAISKCKAEAEPTPTGSGSPQPGSGAGSETGGGGMGGMGSRCACVAKGMGGSTGSGSGPGPLPPTGSGSGSGPLPPTVAPTGSGSGSGLKVSN